ncbi:MAG: glycosyltransferase family A protein [Planctomycetota bacterium]
MKFSVVMPCHNNADHVAAALDSIAAQHVVPYEIIVVNDASTDDSEAVVKQSGIASRVINTQCGNAAGARNAGIKIATGDWVAFLDADNTWLPNHLQLGSECLSESSDVMYYASDVAAQAEMPEGDVGPREAYPIDQKTLGLTHRDFIKWRLYKGWGFPTTGMIARRDRVEQVGGFDESQKRRHDFEFMMRVIHGHTWCTTPQPTWWSRPPREGNISADTLVCNYYAFRALKLNEQAYKSDDYDLLMQRSALNAIKSAVYSRDKELIAKARDLTRGHLNLTSRLKMGLFTAAPPAWRRFMITE